ncbi:hypothetical protein DBR06_SOUSAS14010034, partial [Sousa chinensis]
FLSSVTPFMCFKRTGINEYSLTFFTFIRSIPSMCYHVFLKGYFPCEGFPTFLTFIGFFSSVDS